MTKEEIVEVIGLIILFLVLIITITISVKFTTNLVIGLVAEKAQEMLSY